MIAIPRAKAKVKGLAPIPIVEIRMGNCKKVQHIGFKHDSCFEWSWYDLLVLRSTTEYLLTSAQHEVPLTVLWRGELVES